MSITEEEYNERLAADIVTTAVGADRGDFMFIALLDRDDNIVQDLDRNLARAVAYRLLKLADNAPPPRVILPSRADKEAQGEDQASFEHTDTAALGRSAVSFAKELVLVGTNTEFGALRTDMVESLVMREVYGKPGAQHEKLLMTTTVVGCLLETIQTLADEIAGVDRAV